MDPSATAVAEKIGVRAARFLKHVGEDGHGAVEVPLLGELAAIPRTAGKADTSSGASEFLDRLTTLLAKRP